MATPGLLLYLLFDPLLYTSCYKINKFNLICQLFLLLTLQKYGFNFVIFSSLQIALRAISPGPPARLDSHPETRIIRFTHRHRKGTFSHANPKCCAKRPARHPPNIGRQSSPCACGVDQWQDGYPNVIPSAPTLNATGRVLVENGAVIATAAVYVGHEATYDRSAAEAGGRTRLSTASSTAAAAAGEKQRRRLQIHGLLRGVSPARPASLPRCDRTQTNAIMQHTLEKNGYVRCGTIYLADGAPRIGYERVL